MSDSQDKPCLLVVGYVWPEPNSSAAGLRMLHLLDAFAARGYRVVFASAAALSVHRVDLVARGMEERSIALNCSSFDAFVRELAPQVVLFDRFFTEEQFGWRVAGACPWALRIIDTEDFHALRLVRQALLKEQLASDASVLVVNTDVALTAAALRRDPTAQRECAAIMRSDLSLMISPYEMHLLRDYFAIPASHLFYIPLPNVVDETAVAPVEFAARQHFVSIGNFRHEPNWDAVRYLKEFVWPQLRARVPGAELHIYGAYPPPKATQLHNPKQGFYVDGWAADAHQVLRNARVLLAPLRFGAGIKGKLWDALATQTPSVTTPIGVEGMQDDAGTWCGSVCDNLEAFVTAAAELYYDKSLWQAQQAQASVCRAWLQQVDYANALLDRLEQVRQQLTAHRASNFWGSVLQSETAQSAKYKGLWIEAKNRP